MLLDIGQYGFIRPPSQVHFSRLYPISAHVLAKPGKQLLCASRIVVDVQESDVALIPNVKKQEHLNCFGNLDAIIVRNKHFFYLSD